MTRPTITFLFILFGLTNHSMATSAQPTHKNMEEEKVIAAVETMTAAFQSKNINGVLTSYEQDAAVMFEPGKRISNPAILKQMFEGAFQLNPKFSYPKGHEVYISQDVALHIAPWAMQGTTPDGASVEQTGLSIAVLRKQKNGQWLMVLDNPHGQLLLEK